MVRQTNFALLLVVALSLPGSSIALAAAAGQQQNGKSDAALKHTLKDVKNELAGRPDLGYSIYITDASNKIEHHKYRIHPVTGKAVPAKCEVVYKENEHRNASSFSVDWKMEDIGGGPWTWVPEIRDSPDGYDRTPTIDLLFRDMRSVSVMPYEQLKATRFVQKNGTQPKSVVTKPSSLSAVVMKLGPDNSEKYLVVRDEKSAEKIAAAMRHAMELCGVGATPNP